MGKFDSELKLEVVRNMLQGDLLLEEAMEKYRVKSKLSIIRWIKEYSELVKSEKGTMIKGEV